MSDLANKQVHPPLFKVGDVAKTEAGLTLREHFAGLALQGVLSDPSPVSGTMRSLTADDVAKVAATAAVLFADALIAELSKGGA